MADVGWFQLSRIICLCKVIYCYSFLIEWNYPCDLPNSLWRPQLEKCSALLALCEGNPPRPVTQSFDVVFDLRLNKRMSKQSKRWWFRTPSHSLLRHFIGADAGRHRAHYDVILMVQTHWYSAVLTLEEMNRVHCHHFEGHQYCHNTDIL